TIKEIRKVDVVNQCGVSKDVVESGGSLKKTPWSKKAKKRKVCMWQHSKKWSVPAGTPRCCLFTFTHNIKRFNRGIDFHFYVHHRMTSTINRLIVFIPQLSNDLFNMGKARTIKLDFIANSKIISLLDCCHLCLFIVIQYLTSKYIFRDFTPFTEELLIFRRGPIVKTSR